MRVLPRGDRTTTPNDCQSTSESKGSARVGCTLALELIITPLCLLAFFGAFIHFARFFEYDVQGVPELRKPPYNPNIWAGTVLPVVTGSFVLFWTIVSAFAGFIYSHTRIYWLVVTLGRLVWLILLIVCILLQWSYLPHQFLSCDDSWPEDSGVPYTTPTMYDLLPYRAYYSKSSHGMVDESPCERLWFIWVWEIICLGILVLATFFSCYMLISPTPVKYNHIGEEDRIRPKLRRWSRSRFVEMPGLGESARGEGYAECGPANAAHEDEEAMGLELRGDSMGPRGD